MSTATAWGYGLATLKRDGSVLDTWFPEPRLGVNSGAVPPPENLLRLIGEDSRRAVKLDVIAVQSDLDSAPSSVPDAYLRLHLLSHRLVVPNSINLDGLFAILPTVCWSNAGPIDLADATRLHSELQRAGISIHSVDKFPRLVDYHLPEGVRIADANRVRLGAYLSPGTTVMHEGFVNFNAGTLGAAMVEGRISQGVVVGDGADIGGGASIMGTLSGGGSARIIIGERTLLGANSGIGISLGDDCIVEAGLYLTAGMKVVLADSAVNASGQLPTAKAETLSGRSGLLYRRNSLTGAVEVLRRSGEGIKLNKTLHA